MTTPIRVLIADDSPTVRRFLADLIAESPDMTVIGEACDGQEAVEVAARLRPDIISMDVKMPRLDGLAATRHLMENMPTPVVIVSGYLHRRPEQDEVDLAFLALQAGALAVLETPPSRNHPEFLARRDEFLNTLRTMVGVSLVRRWGGQAARLEAGAVAPRPLAVPDYGCKVMAIGASAGGPMALHQLLGALPADFPVPVAIVQHIAEGFVEGLVRWLNDHTPLRVMLAEQGQIVRPGEAVVAGGGAHLTLRCVDGGARVVLRAEQGDVPYMPAVDVLFESVARNFGGTAVGVLLTGMGADGAQGLLAMLRRGARTIAQDEATCLVYGMPGAAVQLGAAEQVLPLHRIAPTLIKLL